MEQKYTTELIWAIRDSYWGNITIKSPNHLNYKDKLRETLKIVEHNDRYSCHSFGQTHKCLLTTFNEIFFSWHTGTVHLLSGFWKTSPYYRGKE